MTSGWPRAHVAAALGLAVAAALAGSPGCSRASQDEGRRPANAALLLLSRSSLKGNLLPVG